MLLFRTSMPNSVGWRCSGRTWGAAWDCVLLPSPPLAAVWAASSATATDAQSTATIQKVDLIIPSMQTSKMKLREPAANPTGANAGKMAGVCGGVYGLIPRCLQAPQTPNEPQQRPNRGVFQLEFFRKIGMWGR